MNLNSLFAVGSWVFIMLAIAFTFLDSSNGGIVMALISIAYAILSMGRGRDE